jgi:protein-S-isoprenylcysteine O-methyltransferase Ste14
MNKAMTIWGIGDLLALSTIIFTILIAAVNWFVTPQLRFTLLGERASIFIGSALILIGIVVLLISARTVTRVFQEGKLATTGIYGIVRNPLYSAWIILIVPGIVIISGYLLWWLIPIFMYLVFKLLIKKENEYLEHQFGDEYRAYRKKVNELFPRIL